MTRPMPSAVANYLLPLVLAASIVGHTKRLRARAEDVAGMLRKARDRGRPAFLEAMDAEDELRWADAAKAWDRAAHEATNETRRERFAALTGIYMPADIGWCQQVSLEFRRKSYISDDK